VRTRRAANHLERGTGVHNERQRSAEFAKRKAAVWFSRALLYYANVASERFTITRFGALLIACGTTAEPAGKPARTTAPMTDAMLPDRPEPIDGAAEDASVDAQPTCSLSDRGTTTPLFHSERVVTGLSNPWSIDQLPNGDWLITERGNWLNATPGALRIVRGGVLDPVPVPGTPPTMVLDPQAGLLDLVLHPNFKVNHWVYLSYVKASTDTPPKTAPVITRYTFENGQLQSPTVIYPGFFYQQSSGHYGGRMLFGNDGKLYFTIGDGHSGAPAQDLLAAVGKTLRLNDDGTIPSDNPLLGMTGVPGEIFTYGHRNPQGLASQPGSNRIFSTEHGDVGCDEINWLQAGRNYGWPDVTCTNTAPGVESPLVQFTPSEAPSGAFFYTGLSFKEWCGDLFVAALIGAGVLRLRFNDTTFMEREKYVHYEDNGRVRDVAQGQDGFIYFIEDALGSAQLKRLVPGAGTDSGM
jgi:aldose sugar dehydrogenase